MFATCLMLGLIAFGVAPAAEPKDPFTPAILVRAKAVRVTYWQNRDWQQVIFRIEHVYSGDPKLKGKTFREHLSVVENSSRNEDIKPPIKEGEVGLWHLMHAEDDGRLTVHIHNPGTHKEEALCGWELAIPAPARKLIGQQGNYYSKGNRICYISALQWWHVVETVYEAPLADRPKLLKEYISSDNPYVAAWAARILAEYKPADLIPFLNNMIDDAKLSVGAQVTIDAILSRIDRKKWLESKRRAALFQRWISGDISTTLDVLMIAAHIKNALEYHGEVNQLVYNDLDWNTWLPLMEKWVAHQSLFPSFEDRLYSTYQNGNNSKLARDRIVPHAIHLLKTSKDEETQRYAAKWLAHMDILTEEQLTVVRDLERKATTPQIRAFDDRDPEVNTTYLPRRNPVTAQTRKCFSN